MRSKLRRDTITNKGKGKMSISVHPALEAKLREKAEAEGLTIEAYVERLLRSEEQADEELERLALEGLNSGEPIEITSGYWEEQHRRLDQRLKKTGIQ
jgi:antitoxin ParD1/3/4